MKYSQRQVLLTSEKRDKKTNNKLRVAKHECGVHALFVEWRFLMRLRNAGADEWQGQQDWGVHGNEGKANNMVWNALVWTC